MDDFKKSMRLLAIDEDIIKDINRFKKNLYFNNPCITWDKVQEEIYSHFVYDVGTPPEVVRQGIMLVANQTKRRTRCLEKTKTLVNDNKLVIFGTLTFTNEVLDKTSPETRRKYVSRYLKSISSSYIANIDFGDKSKNPQSNEREHYHCLIAVESVPQSWKYGFCKFDIVPKEEVDCKRVSKYIAKLSNHALKVERTGKAKRLIYSRGVVVPYWLLE